MSRILGSALVLLGAGLFALAAWELSIDDTSCAVSSTCCGALFTVAGGSIVYVSHRKNSRRAKRSVEVDWIPALGKYGRRIPGQRTTRKASPDEGLPDPVRKRLGRAPRVNDGRSEN